MQKKLSPPHNSKEVLERLNKAQDVVSSYINETALSYSNYFSNKLNSSVYIKMENAQITGSFKIRGALNKLVSLSEEEKQRGVIASSAGNHAQGVALGAKRLGMKAKIVMPETSPLVKIEGTKNYGGEVVLHGDFYDEAYQHALELADQQGLTFIHPYHDDAIIAGQGTVALEIFKEQPSTDLIIVPLGGGGLISGVAMAAKALNPKCKVIGVQTEVAASMSQLFHGQKAETSKRVQSIADGIAVKTPSEEIYQKYIKQYVDDIVTVSEDEIAASMVWLLEKKKTVVEGAGAVAMTAMMYRQLPKFENATVILSGGNVDLNTVSKIIQRGLIESGRRAQLSVVVDDFPGTLNKISSVIGEYRANILDVSHNRTVKDCGLRETRVDFVLETSDEDHIERIRQALRDLGMRVIT